jgi:cytochrome b involved in lipid metabolism
MGVEQLAADGVAEGMSYYSMEDVAAHNSTDSNWLVISGLVYDVTEFRDIHPGGAGMIDTVAGKDATDFFMELHKPAILEEIASEYIIGMIGEPPAAGAGVLAAGAVEEVIVDDTAKVTGKENQIYSAGGRTLTAEAGIREVSITDGLYTLAEVGLHNTLDDMWLAIDGKVYDITKFAADHPGGKEVLGLYAGQDGSAER